MTAMTPEEYKKLSIKEFTQAVIDKYFTGTVSRVGGITLEDIEDNVEKLHSEAFDPLGLTTDLTLDSVGAHKMRSQGEEHRYNPATIHLLQQGLQLPVLPAWVLRFSSYRIRLLLLQLS